MIKFSEREQEEDMQLLTLTVSAISAELKVKTWDTALNASINKLEIQDHYNTGRM